MSEKKSSEPLLPCLERNLEAIRDALRTSSDLAVHEFNFGHDRRYRGAIVFISDMADKDEINKNILQPLMFGSLLISSDADIDYTKIDNVARNLVPVTDSRKVALLYELLDSLLAGAVILLWTVRKRLWLSEPANGNPVP